MPAEYAIKTLNRHLNNPGTANASSSQHIELIHLPDQVVARVEAYITYGYFSAYWLTHLPPEQLVQLAEKMMTYYETTYQEGVPAIDGNIAPLEGISQTEDDIYLKGSVYYLQDQETGKISKDHELPYQRPLDWKQFRDNSKDEPIPYARLNTPLADFVITPEEKFQFCFLSHLAKSEGFAQLLSESTESQIPLQTATEFFEAMLALFTVKD